MGGYRKNISSRETSEQSYGKNQWKKRVTASEGETMEQFAESYVPLGEKIDTIRDVSEELDLQFGFERINEGPARLGWLVNMQPNELIDPETNHSEAVLDLYFVEQDGTTFKTSIFHRPYFYIAVEEGRASEIESYLRNHFNANIHDIIPVEKEDLDLKNHLAGLQKTYLKLVFRTVPSLITVKKQVSIAYEKNMKRVKDDLYNTATNLQNASVMMMGMDADALREGGDLGGNLERGTYRRALDYIIDVREYDVPYYMRVSIDLQIRVGQWYQIRFNEGKSHVAHRPDLLRWAEPRVLAFDIETTKMPLRFPDAEIDSVMMISYMIDGRGYLITNRECVGADIEPFEYTPKPEYEGPFKIFNEPNEEALLKRFFDHIKRTKPTIFVTFNGDFFDWPFVDKRASKYGLSMMHDIGVYKSVDDEYKSRYASHMDVFRWVARDSYLPQGSHGLKAVTRAKLGYDPLEVDPEEMVSFAKERPQTMASYSVSDAVATYYLYMKYVHPFIFSLCTIIPMNPDDVLRKGSGTLCESLLMVKATDVNIIYPNKKQTEVGKMYNGHMLESETYIGGHVEALRSGVFRDDLPEKFTLDPARINSLIENVDEVLHHAIVVESRGRMNIQDVANYDEIKEDIVNRLRDLRDRPNRSECGHIYHLDVAAMYPNIILTNRLQPFGVVDRETCAACDFNDENNNCKRQMKWTWRGDYIPANRAEYQLVRNQLESERVPATKLIRTAKTRSIFMKGKRKRNEAPTREILRNDDGQAQTAAFHEISAKEQHELLVKRLREYSKKTYKKTHQEKVEERDATVCMRENPFYVDTVRNFRDRRYEFKDKLKEWQGNARNAKTAAALQEAKDMVVLYDSLQLAHKCILNSFYGYVMRRGARWFSMEMAGIVTHTGSEIIKQARELVECVGRPLELDTDGIWAVLPNTFPENYEIQTAKGKRVFNYACVLLNAQVDKYFANDQYQQLNKETGCYETRRESTIEFEVDGPYKAMILPASKEEGKKLKKRYAVFHLNGTLAELKGFEIKRRGELKLIKIFQSQVFQGFLEGSSIEECYVAVARIADRWLDVLYTKGKGMDELELMSLISCSSNMSKKLEDYGSQKSTAITTARRLAEFLGNQMVRDKGLACQFVISKYPIGAPIVERVIPTAIFSAEESVKKHFIMRWCKDRGLTDISIRAVLDWEYYIERLGSAIQKIVTIPAAMQGVPNPVPRVAHPVWLQKKLSQNTMTQKKIGFSASVVPDIESIGTTSPSARAVPRATIHKSKPYHRIDTMMSAIPAEEEEEQDENTAPSANDNGLSLPKKAQKKQKNTSQQVIPAAVCPDRSKDFVGWLTFMKAKWKTQREQRRQQRAANGIIGGTNLSGADGYFHQKQMELLTSTSDVIQIRPVVSNPGLYRLFLLQGKQLYPLTVEVPREFYVNSSEVVEGMDIVAKHLPRSQVVNHLYKYSMREEDFIKRKRDLQRLWTQPEVEGVYETNVPLVLKAVMQLGARVKPDAPSLQAALAQDKSVSLSAFNRETSSNSQAHYLSPPSRYRCMYIFTVYTEGRGWIGVVTRADASISVHVVVISPASGNVPGIAKIIEQQHPGANVIVDRAKGKSRAFRLLAQKITQYLSTRRGPLIALCQTPMDQTTLLTQLPPLNEIPVACIPYSNRDTVLLTQPFGWEQELTRKFLTRFHESEKWFAAHTLFSQYVGVPIGNLLSDGSDYPGLALDIMYGRMLAEADLLLWMSSTGRPDLGSAEEDDNSFEEEIAYPRLGLQGMYGKPVVELCLRNLCVDAVLEGHNLMQEVEELGDGDNATSSISLDSGTSCWRMFKVLRALVTKLSLDIGETLSSGSAFNHTARFAELMLDHLYRWLSSPSSRLYDPALHSLVHRIMRKIFVQLLQELKKLGATVVYADYTKIVIETNKKSMKDADQYVQFVLGTLKTNSIFSWLHMEPVGFWDTFLFMDSSNFGGIVSNEAKTFTNQLTSSENISQQISEESVVANWNIAEHLPEAAQQYFLLVVGDYLVQCHSLDHADKSNKGNKNHSSTVSISSIDASTQDMDLDTEIEEAKSGTFDNYAAHKNLITTHLSQQLFEIVHDIQRMVLNSEEDVALNFVKYVCHVLGLDERVKNEVNVLRNQLLKLVKVREFAKESVFVNPCPSYILPDVICSYCSSIHHLDLLRDPLLHEASVTESDWECEHCGNTYNMQEIEGRLVDIVQRRSLSYHTQDLECSKCGLVKLENMIVSCTQCSGPYVLRENSSNFHQFLLVFKRIADTYKFQWLSEVVEWLMN